MSALPTVEEIRKQWAYTMAGDRIHRTDQYFALFDEVIKTVKADAWDEGALAVSRQPNQHINPYREGS